MQDIVSVHSQYPKFSCGGPLYARIALLDSLSTILEHISPTERLGMEMVQRMHFDAPSSTLRSVTILTRLWMTLQLLLRR